MNLSFEFQYPSFRVVEAGADVDLVNPHRHNVGRQAMRGTRSRSRSPFAETTFVFVPLALQDDEPLLQLLRGEVGFGVAQLTGDELLLKFCDLSGRFFTHLALSLGTGRGGGVISVYMVDLNSDPMKRV